MRAVAGWLASWMSPKSPPRSTQSIRNHIDWACNEAKKDTFDHFARFHDPRLRYPRLGLHEPDESGRSDPTALTRCAGKLQQFIAGAEIHEICAAAFERVANGWLRPIN